MKNINVKNVNVQLLRKQVKSLISIRDGIKLTQTEIDSVDGVINLLESMIDISEGKL